MLPVSNYFFLWHWSKSFFELIKNKQLTQVVATSAFEIYFEFEDITLKYIFTPIGTFYYVSENTNIPKGRKLFTEIYGKKIAKIYPIAIDRSLVFEFTNQEKIWIKLYGKNGNILYFKKDGNLFLFKNNIEKDKSAKIPESIELIDKENIFNNFSETETIKSLPPEIRTPDNIYAKILGYFSKENLDMILEANDIFKNTIPAYFFNQKKQELTDKISKQINSVEKNIQSKEISLKFLKENYPNDKKGHLLMAYSYNIAAGLSEVELADFETNELIKIKLDSKLNAIQNAEKYYKKAKKDPLQLQLLEQQIVKSKINLENLKKQFAELDATENRNSIQKFEKNKTEIVEKKIEKFKHFRYENYEIFVGKNAANNDELTMHFAQKEDIWLHAFQVSGSHVVIKKKKEEVPKKVIQKAAEIAAYFSGSKSSAMVNVIYTPKKFVRKPKGANPGAVKVEKYESILVCPQIDI